MMRAREILQEYKKGRRNFQGVSLRGLSFKGKDVSGADFSRADIRGTNFRGANLRGAKFQGATAGLQKRWVGLLLAGVFVLAGISGFITTLTFSRSFSGFHRTIITTFFGLFGSDKQVIIFFSLPPNN
ncbi:MAG: pentapeptide repeat-containing protein [Microcoleaceae cyanobacterium]